MNNLVSLNYLDDYNIDELRRVVENALCSLDAKRFFHSKMKVLIKVCLPEEVSKDSAESTHPAVVRTVVDILANSGVECIVAECPNKKFTHKYLDDVYMATGMLEMANLTKCVLNRDLSTSKIKLDEGVMTKTLTLLDVVNQVDAIINIGKLKIDENLGYMGVCSNLFGLVPANLQTLMLSQCENLGDFNNYIIDIYETIKSKIQLNILDAVVALEAGKTQRMLNCLAFSENMFSLDAVMLDILNIKYEHTILKQAIERDLFDCDKSYKIVDEKIEKFKVEDFVLTDFDCRKTIKSSKVYFKTHQQRQYINKNKCKGCKICSKICPTNAIVMKYDNNSELYAQIDYSKCIYCKKCITACPYSVVEEITPKGYKSIEKHLEKYNKKDK